MPTFRFIAPLVLALGLSACGDATVPTEKTGVNTDGIAVLKLTNATAGNTRQWDGVVEAVNQTTLSAQTSGRVAELLVDVNDSVKVGQVLARFSNVEQRSGQNRALAGISAAQAQTNEAEADFKRMSAIYEKRLIAKAQYDQSLARRDAARAQLASARALLSESSQQLDYTIIRAPFNGVIGQRHVQAGETVAPGQPIFSMNSPGQLRVRLSLPQADAEVLEQNKKAKIILDNGKEITVESIIVFPDADPDTHTVTVRLMLPDAMEGIKPGLTVKAILPAAGNQGLLIPVSALIQRSEVTSVYVVAEKTLRLRQIRLGNRVGNQVQVLSGLSAGESIATDPLAANIRLSEQQASK
ncbi:MAG: efflux RND transporter periplasmic adaptor subunit [Arenimonas sp.]